MERTEIIMTLPKISVSEQLAAAFCDVAPTLPIAVTSMCDAVLMDVVGLCVAARNSDYLQAAVRASAEPGACTLIGRTGGFNVAAAALCNGTAAHGEDYDDTFEGGPIHAGAVIIPAMLAAAERHRLTGSDVERGIAVGCEIMCRLCLPAPKRVHKAGFHPTAVFGALGAAACVASALRLDAAQWFNALGIAGSMASGIIEYLAEGAWTKRMHPGWAAQAGYHAARMAQEGFTGPRTLFDGEHGFFHAFANSDDCDFSAMLEGAGREWLCADIAFKPYACGTMAHPYIDCARKLVAQGVKPGDVASIECKTAEGIVHRLWEPLAAKQNPPNGYAAKFSIPYAIAVGMLRGDAGLVEYEEAVVHDPAVRALAGKVRYVVDRDNPYPRRFTGHVRVTLASGEVREASQGHFRGGRDEPMSAEALEAKFTANCTYGGWDADRTRSALATLRALRRAAQVDLSALRG
jgi:2-methylcitrate dehydratase PrpD